MKRYMILVLPFLLLFLQLDTSEATAVSDLDQLVSVVLQHNPDATISGWTAVVRDERKMSSSDMYELLQQENQFKDVQSDRSSITASQVFPQQDMQVSARIVVTDQETSMLIYTVSGNSWSQESRTLLHNLLRKQKFSEEAKSFSCLTGLTDGNMDKDSSKMRSQWLDDFDAQMIEQTTERNFLCCSVKSHFFTDG